MASNMDSYSFPIMSTAAIVEALNESFQLGINEQDLKTPKKERLMHFYMMILGATTTLSNNMNPEIIHMPQLPMTEKQMEFPELQGDSVPLINLTLAMQRLAYACGLGSFHLGDIIQPTPKRILHIFSAFLNFMRFQEERFEVFNRMKTENEAVVEQHKTLLREVDELKQKVNEVKATRAQHEPEVMHLKTVVDGQYEQMKESQKASNSKRKVLSEAKAKYSEKKAAKASLAEELVALRSESARLSSHIVQSPERMKTEQERSAHQFGLLRETRDSRLGRLAEQRTKQEMQAARAAEIDTACKLMTGISVQVNRDKEVTQEVGAVTEAVQTEKDQLKELSVQEVQMKHKVSSKEEKVSKLTLQHNNKMAAATDNLKHLQQERGLMRQQRNDEDAQLVRLQTDRKQLADDNAVTHNEYLSRNAALHKARSQLLEQVDYYHMRLGEEWTKFKQCPDTC